ncbi:hypothetical protein CASFOL_006702 [Castilleja foliolosa]|uniref:F-box domain-containing protein n=1 Tax=Castilleja foliolosa TaxID=1961234 RepID=A0ABD3EB73_9LAMI
MKKGSQRQAINGEFQLPEPIVHRIQSFLTAKEAARTIILSKSWRSAWLTRPNLDLDIDDVGGDEFSEFANKTILRYEQSNLKIESLRLCIGGEGSGVLANDLIMGALKIGATHLNVRNSDRRIVLSQEVFEAENLVELSLEGWEIDDLGFDRKVKCSKLESLSLRSVTINREMISNIASCCPLIWKLSLCDVIPFGSDNVYYSFLGDLSTKFPSLKDLTLDGCNTQEISSRSLERLNFVSVCHMLNVKFDVPSIRKFRFETEDDEIPSLSFVSAPSEWESDAFILDRYGNLSVSWFLRLNKFLTGLSPSRISLTLEIVLSESCEYEVGDIQCLPKPEVENLTISMTQLSALDYFTLFHGVFQICRPKFITVGCESSFGHVMRNDLVCKTLARGLDNKCMYGLHDLEEVIVRFFDEDDGAWQPMPLKSLLNPSVSPTSSTPIRKIRFQLKWKP